jgi:hypothetical protein
MENIFLVCLGLGGLVLVGQLALGLLGLGGGLLDVDAGALGEGLDLLSVRALSAGVALFGVGGLGALSLGLPPLLAAAAALVPGFGGAAGTAYLTRQLLRLESDGSLRLENAVGVPGTVYLPIRPGPDGGGLVHLPLQGRTVELRAVSRETEPIPVGADVIIVAVVDGGTVEVMPTSSLEENLR